MESNAFGSSHLPSQALVVLSEAASGLHEALRGQRPFPSRLPDAKDLHNMSLVGSYGTHLLHSFHPHLLQTLNHGMLAANGGPASYFASDRNSLGKPSVLSNFQLPSAFSPPKYIGISLDQNLFNGSESFRTDSASPTCTSHESMEGSNDYDGEKGESPRSNHSDPRDLRHVHNKAAAAAAVAAAAAASSASNAPTTTSIAAAAAAAAAAVAASVASSTTSSPAAISAAAAAASHLSHHAAAVAAAHPHPSPHHTHTLTHAHVHQHHHHPTAVAAAHPHHNHHHSHHQQQQQQQQSHHQHHQGPPPPPPLTQQPPTHHTGINPHHPHHVSSGGGGGGGGSLLAASMSGLGLRAVGGLNMVGTGGAQTAGGVSSSGSNGTAISLIGGNGGGINHLQPPDICPVCGIKVLAEEWNNHFLTELDRLYKLSAGMERASLQASYIFAPPCPAQENAIRTSHNRWETFQRIRGNRQNRLRIKVRKRKYGSEMYFMDNLLCSSCPTCKRKYALELGKSPEDDGNRIQDEIETVDVESCNDELLPDSNGSEMPTHAQMLGLSVAAAAAAAAAAANNNSNNNINPNNANNNGGIVVVGGHGHNNNLHTHQSMMSGKLDGLLSYRNACVINKDVMVDDVVVSTHLHAASSSNGSNSNGSGSHWMSESHSTASSTTTTTAATTTPVTTTTTTGHISVKNVSELSSTTHHFYNADSCGDERSIVGICNGVGGGGGGSSGSNSSSKDILLLESSCSNANDSDEDVIVDDVDDVMVTTPTANAMKLTTVTTAPIAIPSTTTTTAIATSATATTTTTNLCKKRKYDDSTIVVVSSRSSDSPSGYEERPRSEPQVTSTEPNIDLPNNNNNNINNNNNNTTKYGVFEELRAKQQPQQMPQNSGNQQQQQQTEADTAHNGSNNNSGSLLSTGLTQLDTKVGISSDIKPDDENKCFICKTGIKDLATDSFFRGRNLYFHQSCANVMSSYRLSKDLHHHQQQQQHQQQQTTIMQQSLDIKHSPTHASSPP